MLCDDCHTRPATKLVTQNKQPWLAVMDQKKGRGIVVRCASAELT